MLCLGGWPSSRCHVASTQAALSWGHMALQCPTPCGPGTVHQGFGEGAWRLLGRSALGRLGLGQRGLMVAFTCKSAASCLGNLWNVLCGQQLPVFRSSWCVWLWNLLRVTREHL